MGVSNMKRLLAAGLLGVIAACSADRAMMPPPLSRSGGSIEHLGGGCSLNTSQQTSDYYGAPTEWICGAQVSIWDPSGLYLSQMDQARTAWNSAIYGANGLPSFPFATQSSQPSG